MMTDPATRFAKAVAAGSTIQLVFHPKQRTFIHAMKIARILDEENGTFGLEYDNTVGKKNTMRLYAQSYENAVREAKSFLGISADDQDAEGSQWDIE